VGTMEPEERSGSARLEETILHGEAVYDADQVSAQTGIPLDFAKRLWRALGFPERNTEIAFNDARRGGAALGHWASMSAPSTRTSRSP
jgi:hypothetical protein